MYSLSNTKLREIDAFVQANFFNLGRQNFAHLGLNQLSFLFWIFLKQIAFPATQLAPRQSGYFLLIHSVILDNCVNAFSQGFFFVNRKNPGPSKFRNCPAWVDVFPIHIEDDEFQPSMNRRYGPTDGWTDPLIEMQSHQKIIKQIL